MGEADFLKLIGLRNQLVVSVRDYSKEEKLPPVQVELLAKHGRADQTYKQSCRSC